MEPTCWRSETTKKNVVLLDIVPAMNGIAALLINEKKKLDMVPFEEFQSTYVYCGLQK